MTDADRYAPDSPYAWGRLALSLLLATVACIGSWSVVVALPEVQREFGTLRGMASLPYSFMMTGFAFAAIGMGKLVDRFGIVPVILIGAVTQGLGYVLAGMAPSILVYAFAHVLVGIGASIGFGPLIADISHWFEKNRGLAVAVTATGNYIAGAFWSPIFQKLMTLQGWRWTHVVTGVFVLVAMSALAFAFRRKPSLGRSDARAAAARAAPSSASRRTRCWWRSRSRVSAAAWRCPCRRSISSPIARTSATARRAARRCWR